MTETELKAMVRQLVEEAVEQTARAAKSVSADSGPSSTNSLQATTPARIMQGRTGTRYLTNSYLGLRADHAIALDAVHSEIEANFANENNWIPLHSKAQTHQEYLLTPELGRHLNNESKLVCEKEASKGVDIQLIAGDGLSAVALKTNGTALMQCLEKELKAAGFTVGKPLFVKFARIGVQDEIGVLTQAKATIIVVGERPGLGTGDSLSIYTAFAPKMQQDNSEKDCISNVRALGFVPEQAAAKCAKLMKLTFEAQGGGVNLTGTKGKSTGRTK
jgi:ethanolamine ammonia-lyase small subunit